ncbi:hypothetical protein E2562_024556 [Oryza meyeriana var. granulata]|uniref:Transcription factor MYC/MYB N-terminal domain-containing protein n=1 Tax=Oryza meyeriana var. granulata TaxID=110450 RepID=A0A6G1BNY9_9ORYZ|nr:hypothetical protein E2562_024556 [Oryza meyeriana var. granulata]
MSWSKTDAALFTAVLGHDTAHHLDTTPPHLDAPEVASASLSSAELQARLHDLVKWKGGAWTYGIFWQESRGSGANGSHAVLSGGRTGPCAGLRPPRLGRGRPQLFRLRERARLVFNNDNKLTQTMTRGCAKDLLLWSLIEAQIVLPSNV